MLDDEVNEVLAGRCLDAAQAGDRLRKLEDRGCQRARGVDPDDAIRPAPDQEGALEAGLVEPGSTAEGRDRGADAQPLREIDEQVRGPGVDLLIRLGSDHRAIVPFLDVAHPRLLQLSSGRF